jgi:hypothetical protein
MNLQSDGFGGIADTNHMGSYIIESGLINTPFSGVPARARVS